MVLLFDFQGGYTSDVPACATSFTYRGVLFWLQSYSINLRGSVSQTQIDFLEQVNKNVTLTDTPCAALC